MDDTPTIHAHDGRTNAMHAERAIGRFLKWKPYGRVLGDGGRSEADLVCEFRARGTGVPRAILRWRLSRRDFRPQFDGFLVNAWSAMLPAQNESTTREAALNLLTEMAAWLRDHTGAFETGDQLQLIVGSPESVKHAGRQIIKCWLPASRLHELQGLNFDAVADGFYELERWQVGVVWSSALTA